MTTHISIKASLVYQIKYTQHKHTQHISKLPNVLMKIEPKA